MFNYSKIFWSAERTHSFLEEVVCDVSFFIVFCEPCYAYEIIKSVRRLF
jgi:hypothetical protein